MVRASHQRGNGMIVAGLPGCAKQHSHWLTAAKLAPPQPVYYANVNKYEFYSRRIKKPLKAPRLCWVTHTLQEPEP